MQNTERITVTSVADVPWADVRTVFGTRGDASRCWCQYFKLPNAAWQTNTPEESSALLHAQVVDNEPSPGLIAYLGEEPAGWCGIEPRPNYSRLRRAKVVTEGPDAPSADLYHGALSQFLRAGFEVVSRPTVDRAVVRLTL